MSERRKLPSLFEAKRLAERLELELKANADLNEAQAGLLLPAGPQGPGFLVFRNCDAIYSYNQAASYALAISHLADRLAGHPPLRTPWPTDDPGLTPGDPVGTE